MSDQDHRYMPVFTARDMLVYSTLAGAGIWAGLFLLVMWFLK